MQQQLAFFLNGLISGFTLLISGNTLNFWLASSNVDIKAIGLFSLVSLPYALSFLWAPIFDSIKVPFLHKYIQKNCWLYLLQLILAAFTLLLSAQNVPENLGLIAFISLLIAFCASSQDLILGNIRANSVSQHRQGELSGTYILGYRIGTILSSSGAIALSQYLSWHEIYKLITCVIMLFPFITYYISSIQIADNPKQKISILSESSLVTAFEKIIRPIGAASFTIFVLCFLVLYRLPDNFINAMINPFLLAMGFDAFEIASFGKFLGITSAIIGGVLGSYIMARSSIYSGLLWFGMVHALAHLMFIFQLATGHNNATLLLVMGFESITGGMTMAAYMAFITALAQGEYGVTRYAMLTSMMGLSRSIFTSLAGFIVASYGWQSFFILNSILALPALFMVSIIKTGIDKNKSAHSTS